MTQKASTPKMKIGQKTTQVIKDVAQNTDADELADIIEDPFNIISLLTQKIPQSLRNIKKVEKPKTQNTSKRLKTEKTKSDSKEDSQRKIKEQLVLLLADNHKYGLEDLHRYFQEFVDPLIDWFSETRRKSQRELAAELVRKASQKGKLTDLEMALGIVKKRENVFRKKRA